MRICITRESYHQYLWVISSVPVRICSTHESYPQYPWGYAVPISHIISTHESYPQYPWGYAVPVSHILSTCESYPQYPWGYAVPVSYILSTREDMQYPWVISSVPVSHILSTCEDMQYLWVVLDSFEQGSVINCPKLVTKYQNDSKAELLAVHLRQSLTLTALKGLKVKTKCQPALLLIQVKTISSLWQAAKSINYEVSQEIFSFLHLSHWIIYLHEKIYHFKHFGSDSLLRNINNY